MIFRSFSKKYLLLCFITLFSSTGVLFALEVTKTAITPEMYRVLSEIDTSDRFKEYEGVYSEGKMIELDYDAETVAAELGMSISKLNRIFRTMYATSLHSYVKDKRLELAARILEQNNIQISEAALKSGYTNMSHFSKSFLKKYGVLPKDY